MGSADVQGPLWGARATIWADLTEPAQVPFYEAVFDRIGVDSTTHLFDAGCGAGLAMVLAAKRGATVTGLDASEGLLEVARQRLPDAELRQGDLEQLPFADESFNAATSFNAVQYAANPQVALRELGRVVATGKPIVVVTWGDPQRCEMSAVLAAIGGLLPPPPPGAGGPFALSAPGALEAFVEAAGLVADDAAEVPTPFVFADVATGTAAQSASGPAIRAINHAGEAAVTEALDRVMADHRRPDGSVRFENVFRYVVAHR